MRHRSFLRALMEAFHLIPLGHNLGAFDIAADSHLRLAFEVSHIHYFVVVGIRRQLAVVHIHLLRKAEVVVEVERKSLRHKD